ncbi:hypothetical protein K488DRAFT_74581 [Vararia minispora EC-137]|uniref:Uncharacterized protein n=1 Tax=Vararia minispora EC-137 TaxID=1314806 RepID=A0ACB8Q6N6_9AGAM|nr:hypothetical protein K488DRAFT_74581 [Vararia minispora EC-137]
MPIGRPPGLERREFTNEEDILLYKYLATYNPRQEGRKGHNIYKQLGANAQNKWPWSRNHSWQSWRNRYMKAQAWFDYKIAEWQRKYNIDPMASPKFIKARSAAETAEATLRQHTSSTSANSNEKKRVREFSGDSSSHQVKRVRPVVSPVAQASTSRSAATTHDNARSPSENSENRDDAPAVVDSDDYAHAVLSSSDEDDAEEDELAQDSAEEGSLEDSQQYVIFPLIPIMCKRPSLRAQKSTQGHGAVLTSQELPTPPQTTPAQSRTSLAPSYEVPTPSQLRRDAGSPDPIHDTPRPTPPPASQRPMLRKRTGSNSDIFRGASTDSSPIAADAASDTSDTPVRKPPRYDIGPYNGAFASFSGKSNISPSGRRTVGVGTDAQEDFEWPPKRPVSRPNRTKDPADAEPPAIPSRQPSALLDATAEDTARPVAGASLAKHTSTVTADVKTVPVRRSREQVNAVASSSNVRLPPSLRGIEDYAQIPHDALRTIFPRPAPLVYKPAHPHDAPPAKPPSLAASLLGQRSPSEALSTHHVEPFALAVPRAAHREISPFSDADPFTAESPSPAEVKGKGKASPIKDRSRDERRQTFGGFAAVEVNTSTFDASVPTVDPQRASVQRRRSLPALSSIASNRKAPRVRSVLTAEPGRPRTSLGHADRSTQDQSLLMELGRRTFIVQAAKEFGFQENIVQSVFHQEKSLERVRTVLARMREAALEQFLRYDGSQEEMDEGREVRGTDESNGEFKSEEMDDDDEQPGDAVPHPVGGVVAYDSARDPRLREGPRISASGLHYRPTAPSSPPYIPPAHSRARQHVRLSNDGRADEARQRETARASPRKTSASSLRALNDPRRDITLSPSPAGTGSVGVAARGPVTRRDVIVHGGVTMLRADTHRHVASTESKSASAERAEVEGILSSDPIGHDANSNIDADVDIDDQVEGVEEDELSVDDEPRQVTADNVVNNGDDASHIGPAEARSELSASTKDNEIQRHHKDQLPTGPPTREASIDLFAGVSGDVEFFTNADRDDDSSPSRARSEAPLPVPNDDDERYLWQALCDGDVRILWEMEERFGWELVGKRAFEHLARVLHERTGEDVSGHH